MQVKRFVAANMRLALKMVREEMGPDAIILSNKRVPEGVELLISLEHEAESEPAAATTFSGNPFQPESQPGTPAPESVPTADQPSKLSVELERMQVEAKQRAEAVAAALVEKHRHPTAPAEVNLVDQPIERTEPESPAVEAVDFSRSLQAQLDTGSIADTPAVPSTSEDNSSELSEMRVELQSMRDLLEQQFRSMAWANFSQQNPKQASIRKRLKRMGIGANVAESLLTGKTLDGSGPVKPVSDAWQSIMAELCSKLPVAEDDLVENGGVFAFVGPTGAGKTTTIGKLAARYVLSKGAEGVAMVTTDTMRIAAHEQLRTFGRILNVPVKIVDKNNSLERVLYSLRHKSLVLVDTAGLHRHDERLQQQLNSLNEAGNRLRTLLVLPATSQVAVIKSAYYTYQTDNLTGCVLTKLDESASLGEVLTLAIDKALPVAYTTDGQGIPDDIKIARTDCLVRSAIELAKQVTADEALMAEEFSQTSR